MIHERTLRTLAPGVPRGQTCTKLVLFSFCRKCDVRCGGAQRNIESITLTARGNLWSWPTQHKVIGSEKGDCTDQILWHMWSLLTALRCISAGCDGAGSGSRDGTVKPDAGTLFSVTAICGNPVGSKEFAAQIGCACQIALRSATRR